jgi:hypothetical protein
MFTKFLVISSVATVISMFGMWATAGSADAAEIAKAPACKIMYVNGDALVICKRAPVTHISK